MNIRDIKGVGEKRAELLSRLGLNRVHDVLYDFPFRYRDRTKLQELFFNMPEGECLFKAKLVKKYVSRSAVFLQVQAEMVKIKITYFNAKFVADKFKVGEDYYFFGNVIDGSMANPEFASSIDDSFLRIVPVYHLTEGLSQYVAESIHRNALVLLKRHGIKENLPEFVFLERASEEEGESGPFYSDLSDSDRAFFESVSARKDAIIELHAPTSLEAVETAQRRIVLEELFNIFYKIMIRRDRSKVRPMKDLSWDALDRIPYELTGAQKRAIADIKADLESGYKMNRLVNGDVGCGKSAVAYVASRMVIEKGMQVLFMAPTTVLAQQLYEGYVALFGKKGAAFLSSKQSASEKKAVYEGAADGRIDIVFGTHAVLSENLKFKRLSLVITDEQQRFGIAQRLRALEKAQLGHNLYLTATPIPRTLALSFFADMDISRIDEMPRGRIPVKTIFIEEERIPKMLAFIQSRVDAGEQAYVVLPSIEAGKLNLKKVEARLKKRLNARIASVHGQMSQDEVDEVMAAFKRGDIDVLVATTIIEVGVDNPNATIMAIFESDRFGLSQLHQLRGRVGRGDAKSHCFLLSEAGETDRIEALLKNSDGFAIAERDLEIRGPGSFFGSDQSGRLKISFDFGTIDIARAQLVAKEAVRRQKHGRTV